MSEKRPSLGLNDAEIERQLDIQDDDDVISLFSNSYDSDEDIPENDLGIEDTDEENANDDEAVSDSDDVQDNVPFEPKWRKKDEDIKLGQFSQQVGPSNVIKNLDDYSPKIIFGCFFTKELYDHISFQTNLYATQNQLKFKPTTSDEIELFLAINILMGIKRLPRYRLYWSSDKIYEVKYISSVMSRKRFDWLLSNIHLNDNSKIKKIGEDGYDKLFKVRPYIDMLNKQFEVCYNPTECQSVDESMIKFKGRISFKQYMPMKPIKRGYKVWVRACSSNGYICKFEIYTGKKSEKAEVGLGARVVLDLCKPLEHKNHKIYADNFFSSVLLVNTLLERGLGYCGTIRSNRKLLPCLTNDKDMRKGDSDYRMDQSGISVTKWMDNRSVTIISSIHKGSERVQIRRRQKDGTQKDVVAPKCQADYVKCMGGVDRADMLKSFYEVSRKSKKYWHRIFFHFLDVSIVNAYLISKELKKKGDLLQFRTDLVQDIMGCRPYMNNNNNNKSVLSPTPVKKRNRIHIPAQVRHDQAEHMPQPGEKRKRCYVCSTKKSVHTTPITCSTCQDKTKCMQLATEIRDVLDSTCPCNILGFNGGSLKSK